MSDVLIFSGPHGAGKDTLASEFHKIYPETERIVRHITRPPAPGEVNGVDYYYTDRPAFKVMAQQAKFVEYSDYPDCMAGTSIEEVLLRTHGNSMATIVSNFEEGVVLKRSLGDRGLDASCLFISPVAKQIFYTEPKTYIDELETRMKARRRPGDRIANKLAKAALYREMFLAEETNYDYIHNKTGDIRSALLDITAVCKPT